MSSRFELLAPGLTITIGSDNAVGADTYFGKIMKQLVCLAVGTAILLTGCGSNFQKDASNRSMPMPMPGNAYAAHAVGAKRINAELDADITDIINANSQYKIGVALIDLSDGIVHSYGDEGPFQAASTTKILAASAYYRLVETGERSLDDPMGESTSGAQIREMIQNSDNDSWSRIMDAVGLPELQEYAASIGISYDPSVNSLSPAEMATTLASLYTGKLLNHDDTAELLSYMQNTNYETLIPAEVPAGITVYHKYGLLAGELHDASILTKGGSAYAFAVYTQSEDMGDDVGDDEDGTDVIHQLTRRAVSELF